MRAFGLKPEKPPILIGDSSQFTVIFLRFMSNLNTLKPFKKGYDERRHVKQKGEISITKKIKNMLAEVPPGERITRLEALSRRIVIEAINKGNAQMIRLIWNYVDGMPKESIEMKGEIEHKENKILDLLKDADPETRKKIVEGFVKIFRKRRVGGDISE